MNATLAHCLHAHAQRRGAAPALRAKQLGIWQTWSWNELATLTRHIACGLAEAGLQRGDTIALLGDNRPHLHATMLAAQALGAVALPLCTSGSIEELAVALDAASVRRAFAEDQEQVDKLLACRDRGARPEVLWFDRPRGLRHYRDAGLESLGTLIDAGRRRDHRDPAFFDAQLAQGQADDAAARFVERNADGDLRLVTLSHRQLLQRAQTAARAAALRHRDEVLACLSPASLAHSAAGAAQWLVCGYVLSCPESPETMPTDLREIGPTYYAASPHLLQAQFAELQERMHEAGALRRRLFERFPGRTPPALGGLRGAAWRLLIGAPLRNAIGLSRVRAAHLLGDSLHGDVQAFYRALRLEFTPLTDVPQGGGAA